MRTLACVMGIDTAPAQLLEILETPQSLAKILRTTPQTVNAWHRKGILPARISIGRVIRFDRDEALKALAARCPKPEVLQ